MYNKIIKQLSELKTWLSLQYHVMTYLGFLNYIKAKIRIQYQMYRLKTKIIKDNT